MPQGSGIDVARRLRAVGLTLGILILTAFDDPPYIKAAIEAGANGYVLKSSDADTIVEAVRAVYEGKQILNVPLSPSLPGSSPGQAASQVLTEREQEILRLAARG